MAKSIVVVPTYNEAGNLPTLVARIVAAGDYDILVVDDGSPDGTGQLAEELGRALGGRVSVLHRQGKLGLGTAYVAGFRQALARGYDLVFQMDADLSHDPAALNALQAALLDADVAVGSRYTAGGGTADWPWRRRLLSSGGSLYARMLLGLPIRDVTGGFKGFRRQALEALDLDRVGARGFGCRIEMNYRLHRQGFRFVEVPIVFADRQVGQSKMGMSIVTEALLLPWQLRLGLAPGRASAGSWLRALSASWRGGAGRSLGHDESL